jgi:hypothetical protein
MIGDGVETPRRGVCDVGAMVGIARESCVRPYGIMVTLAHQVHEADVPIVVSGPLR